QQHLSLIAWACGFFCLCPVATYCAAAQSAAGPVGVFEGRGDVGAVLHAGSVEYDGANHAYTVSGSGENMWSVADAFQYVWKKVSGDVTLTAEISFLSKSGNEHKKAVLILRQTLDGDSVYADVALHASGLTSLQFRDEKGAVTHEIQSNISAPKRLRIAKRGDYVYMALAADGGESQVAGGWLRIPLPGPFYVGLGVCSHDKDASEQAVFSKVELNQPAYAAGEPALYSDLETMVYIVPNAGRTPRLITQKPPTYWHGWSPDGKTLAFVGERNGDFDIYSIPAEGGGETRLTTAKGLDDGPEYSPDGNYIYFNSVRTGTMQIWRMHSDGSEQEQVFSDDYNNWFPHISPDGQWMVFLTYEKDVSGHPENKD